MAYHEFLVSEFHWHERYRVTSTEEVLTPALVLYPEFIAPNIGRILHLLGGDADRWRAHIKTANLADTVRMLVERGVRNFECVTGSRRIRPHGRILRIFVQTFRSRPSIPKRAAPWGRSRRIARAVQ
jgi:hypothetical protein